jgi:SAM-dependent methyltransferase
MPTAVKQPPCPVVDGVSSNFPAATRCPGCGNDNIGNLLAAPDRFHGRNQFYQLLRCSDCSLVWLKDPPKAEDMAQHYGDDYDQTIAEVGEASPGRWQDRTTTLASYKQGGKILDLGCSSGSFLKTLDGKGWELYGVEMSTESATRAKTRCGASVFVGDILDAPFPSGMFDAVTCFHVFEHLYQPRETLAKVVRWLKPGGVFYTLMPNIDSAGARIFGSYWYPLELPRHLYHFSPKSLERMAGSVGLEAISVTTGREVFIEHSTRYIIDDVLKKLGMPRTCLARRPALGFPRKVIRKAFRMTVLPLMTSLAGLAGDGESIHAVFRKPESRSVSE